MNMLMLLNTYVAGLKREEGQGLAEYALIIVLVARSPLSSGTSSPACRVRAATKLHHCQAPFIGYAGTRQALSYGTVAALKLVLWSYCATGPLACKSFQSKQKIKCTFFTNSTVNVLRAEKGTLSVCNLLLTAKRNESALPMKKNLCQEQGNSLIEFTLLLPVFLLLVLGVFDFGNGYNTYIGMANAAREGALWLERYPNDRSGMEARINEEVGRVGLNSASIDIQLEPDKISFDSQEMVTVTVESNYPLLFGAITEFSNITLRTQTVIRVR